MLLLLVSLSLKADSLIKTEIYATMGIVTNFILSDESITHHGTTYGKVTSPYTGRVWLDRNLGAKRVCTSFTDTQCYGDYYQWGRNVDGHQDSTSGTIQIEAHDVNNAGNDFIITTNSNTFDWAKIVDSTGILRANNLSKTDGSFICPIGFRVPIVTELKAELIDVGSAEIASNTPNTDTRINAFMSFLKLPTTGSRNTNAVVSGMGNSSVLWSSTRTATLAKTVFFDSNKAFEFNFARGLGASVRCIKE